VCAELIYVQRLLCFDFLCLFPFPRFRAFANVRRRSSLTRRGSRAFITGQSLSPGWTDDQQAMLTTF
jgi:hypothetical protein